MAGLGAALRNTGRTTCLAAAEIRTEDPPRKTLARGTFNPSLRYDGHYTASSRYFFPGHPDATFVTGPSAGHGIEGEILKRVAQHPSDPFGLKAVGIDNMTWVPDQADVHDMSYVEWSNGVSVFSAIDQRGGLLDQLGLRDGAGSGQGQRPGGSEVEQLRADLAAAREQLALSNSSWTKETQAREQEKKAIRGVISEANVPKEKGGRLAVALRTISSLVGMLLLAALVSGCASLRALNPFDAVKPADAEWSGVKSGEPVGLTPTLAGAVDDPRASTLAALVNALGGGDPLGSVLPVSVVGDPSPRWVLCVDEYRLKCQQIPLHAKINFAGRPVGVFWRPSRLTAENFND